MCLPTHKPTYNTTFNFAQTSQAHPRPKKPSILPKVIGTKDIKKLFDVTQNLKHNLMLKLCYGMGLRVSEIINLKITDIDSGNMQVLIEKSKGKKDRYVNLPESILWQLREYYKAYKPKNTYLRGSMAANIASEVPNRYLRQR